MGSFGNSYLAKDSRKNQITFLNKRYIKNPTLVKSADQAFKGSIGIGKYGFYIINISMPASSYDVNVHPTKMEVRFEDEDKIYKILYRAIKTAILDKTFLGDKEVAFKRDEYINDEFDFLTSNFKSKESLEYANKNRINLFSNSAFKDESINHEVLIKRDNKRKIEYKFLGILFKTYIVIEIGEELYLIDQHAAHERILYENIKANYKNNLNLTNYSQMTLIPETINLKNNEIEFIKDNIELFKNVGYDIEFFGENTIRLNGVPNIDYREKINEKDAFLDVLDEMTTNTRSPIKDIEERFIATVACKAAVKAGMSLGIKEVDYLIQNLLVLQNPYTCPHGRPTNIKFNKNDFKKLDK